MRQNTSQQEATTNAAVAAQRRIPATKKASSSMARTPGSRRRRTTGADAVSDYTVVVPPSLHPPPEKRALRYRSSCPVKLYERMERAETQRLYLVEKTEHGPEECHFAVLGSTGNVYDVVLGEIVTCTCPDFVKKQDLCKHILFVTLKVIGLNKTNPLSYQRAYVPSELRHLLQLAQHRRVGGGTVLANATVRNRYARLKRGDDDDTTDHDDEGGDPDAGLATRRPLEDGSDCPICIDALVVDSKAKLSSSSSSSLAATLTYCRGTCGTNFHSDCIRTWKTRGCGAGGGRSAAVVTCPNCRQPWVEESLLQGTTGTNENNNEGYVNLGRLQGQSSVRDTSTYRKRWSPSYRHRICGRYDDDDDDY